MIDFVVPFLYLCPMQLQAEKPSGNEVKNITKIPAISIDKSMIVASIEAAAKQTTVSISCIK